MVNCRLASTIEEWIAALRLVYHSGLQSGVVRPNRYLLRVTPYHLLPTTDLFIGLDAGQIVLTASLVRDGALGLAAENLFREEITFHRKAHRLFGEICCLAAVPGKISLLDHVQLFRTIVQYARFTEHLHDLFLTVHPRQVLFYERFLGFERLGPGDENPGAAGNSMVLLRLDMVSLQKRHPKGYQILFEPALSAEQLWPARLPAEHRRLLEPFVEKRYVPAPLFLTGIGEHAETTSAKDVPGNTSPAGL